MSASYRATPSRSARGSTSKGTAKTGTRGGSQWGEPAWAARYRPRPRRGVVPVPSAGTPAEERLDASEGWRVPCRTCRHRPGPERARTRAEGFPSGPPSKIDAANAGGRRRARTAKPRGLCGAPRPAAPFQPPRTWTGKTSRADGDDFVTVRAGEPRTRRTDRPTPRVTRRDATRSTDRNDGRRRARQWCVRRARPTGPLSRRARLHHRAVCFCFRR